jgi:O-antigen ligase
MTITTINKSFKDRATKGIIEAYKAYDNNIYEGSIGMRIAGWLVSFDVLKENYLFGHGMGEHSDKLKVATQNDERYINIRHFGWYHNQYSEYFTAVGLLGLSIFLLFFYKLWNYQTKDELLKNLPKIFILFNLLIFIGEPILYLREYTIFFALMVGVFLV